MAAYTDADTIEAALDVTFTPEQATQAEAIAAAVTAFIDTYTARTWQLVSPVERETLPIVGAAGPATPASATVYLTHRPALAVSAVSIRSSEPNATPTALDAAEYELLDPVNGVLRLASWYPSSAGALTLAVVDYTYADEVPADIGWSATALAADMLGPTLNPGSVGIDSVSVGQNDVSVRYAGASGKDSANVTRAMAILDGHRLVVIA